jgi:hypothetical protein
VKIIFEITDGGKVTTAFEAHMCDDVREQRYFKIKVNHLLYLPYEEGKFYI